MAKPLSVAVIAVDANYDAGADPWSATPTKVDPTGTVFEDKGQIPETGFGSQYYNHVLNNHGLMLQALDALPSLYGDARHGSAVCDGVGAVTGMTLVGSTYTMNRDCFYEDMTVSANVTIATNSFRLFVRGTLDISAVGANINNNGGPGTIVGAGGGGQTPPISTMRSGAVGGAGGNGSSAVGVAGSAISPGIGGAGGAGGNQGIGGVGGAGGAVTAADVRLGDPSAWSPATAGFATGIDSGTGTATLTAFGGGSGGGGGGSGAAIDGKGGGGGAGGGLVAIAARRIIAKAATDIQAKGGAGLSGGATTGSGGGGGGGGAVILAFSTAQTLAGALITFTAADCCPGGAGGAAGAHVSANPGVAGAVGRLIAAFIP